jgi:outer membrane receptor protein involved in Fe transport
MIEERGITKVNDLFRGDIPGVFTADYGAASFFYGGPVYVRGTTELYDAPALKTYVDGVEVANSQYVNELDPTMIDHIEIIRGPEASTLYGAQAINGVMQVFTKKGSLGTPPHLTASAGITTQEGTYDTGVGQEDHLSVSGGATELSYNVGGTFQREGEWTPRHHVNTYSGYGSLSIRPARSPLHVDITARLGNQVGLGAGNEAVARAVMDGTLKFIGQGLPGRNDYSLPQEALGVTAQYARGGWQQTLTVGVDHGANGNNSGIVAPTYETPKDSLFSVFSSQTARFTAAYNSTWDVRLSDRLAGNLVVGADHWSLQSDTYVDYSTASDEGQLGNGGSIFLARQRDHSTGLFAQARLGLADALFFTAGARVDQGPALPADRHHRSTAPRVGVSYAAAWGNVSAKLRAGYGSALKPANPEERQFFEYFSDYWQLAAPNLKPERQTGWDAGLDLYAGTRSSLSITTYRQFAGDLITTVFGNIGAISTLQFVNVARVLNSGWELEGRVGVLPWLTAKATYTITTSKVDSLAPNDQTGYTVGQSLPGVPHHSGALTLIGRTRRFSGEASVSYVGTAINYDQPHLYQDYFIRLGPPSYAFDLVNTPAAMRFGLRLSYDLTSRLTLLARGENLTNKVVQDQGFIPIDQYGRTTFVGLRWR